MTYPRNAASPEPIAIGAVVQVSDGAVQTSGCTVRIKPIGVAEGDGGGTTAYSTDGVVLYTPTQAETNYTSFVLIAKKTGCIPVSVTVVTSASATAGYVGTDQGKIANATSTVNLSGTTIKAVTDAVTAGTVSDKTGYSLSNLTVQASTILATGTHNPQSGDAFARLGAPAGASVSADIAAAKADTAAILLDTGTDGVVVAAGSKTGYSLASTGLDSIAVTAPSGVASTFPAMVVQLWRRFFRKATKTSSQIKTYADDGTTVVTTQTVSNSGGTETQGAAS